MQTEAQKNFDKKFLFVRKKVVAGKLSLKDAKAWLRLTGLEVIVDSEAELSTEKAINKFKKQSGYEQALMEDIHEEEGYDDTEY